MNDAGDFDPLEGAAGSDVQHGDPAPASKPIAPEEVEAIQAKATAFRTLADRFYILWWNLPGMSPRDVDRHLVDMFQMYMNLAPSMGVSRNTVQELRECCGKKRPWKSDALMGDPSETVRGAISPFYEPPPKDLERLGFGLGDLVARITKVFSKERCGACEVRRRALNAFAPEILVGFLVGAVVAVAGAAAFFLRLR